VLLFPTCSVQWNRPDIGKAAVQVLERCGAEVAVEYPRCCGMPFLDVGDAPAASEARREVVAALLPWARKGYTIVTSGPSCSLMLKKEYPWMSADPDTAELARSVRDLGEFLAELKAKGLLPLEFPAAPKSVAYHLPCHLKVQNIGFKSRDLLHLTGAKVTMVERCSGHDGTWSMKKEYFELSMKVGRKLFDELTDAGADVLASDCPLAALQITQGTGRPVLHPIQVLRDAWGLPRP
jgi:Fe-S oxidoreductase